MSTNADNLRKMWSTLTRSLHLFSPESWGQQRMKMVYHMNSFCGELSCTWYTVLLANVPHPLAYQSVWDIQRIHEWCWNSLLSICDCGPKTPEVHWEAHHWTKNAPTNLYSRHWHVSGRDTGLASFRCSLQSATFCREPDQDTGRWVKVACRGTKQVIKLPP